MRLTACSEADDQQSTRLLLCRVYLSCLLSEGSVQRPFSAEVKTSAVRTCLHLPARSSLPRNGSLVNLTRALSSLSRANAVGI